MAANIERGFRIGTVVLSVFIAGMLFPNIVGRRGVGMSLLITALAVGAIWLIYFFIGRFFEWAVTEEIKRRGRENPEDKTEKKN